MGPHNYHEGRKRPLAAQIGGLYAMFSLLDCTGTLGTACVLLCEDRYNGRNGSGLTAGGRQGRDPKKAVALSQQAVSREPDNIPKNAFLRQDRSWQ